MSYGSTIDISRIKNETRLIYIAQEISKWKFSAQRKRMLEGEQYYIGKQAILASKRMVIGENGELKEVDNVPNNKIIDNQYAKMVNQKANYLLGKPITFDTENVSYRKALSKVFNKHFHRTLKNIGEDVLNCGIAWLYPYYDKQGIFSFMRLNPLEILPFWLDAEHTKLEFVARLYNVETFDGKTKKEHEKIELYYPDRIENFYLKNGFLIPDEEKSVSEYIVIADSDGNSKSYGWGKIPIIPFRYNSREIPLIQKVKSLQDGINTMLSTFENNMQEEPRNTILILKNYDGQALSEFRHNLATHGVIKVRSINGEPGGVETLQVEVNADNYKVILEVFKKALIENAMGYDAKDDRLAGNPNQMNIQSMYSDIDLDANGMETEFQSSFEDLLEIVNIHLQSSGFGDFSNETVRVIFDRDIMINESEVIENCVKSVGILSDETIVSQHPWVNDINRELERKKKEAEVSISNYENAFSYTSSPDITKQEEIEDGNKKE